MLVLALWFSTHGDAVASGEGGNAVVVVEDVDDGAPTCLDGDALQTALRSRTRATRHPVVLHASAHRGDDGVFGAFSVNGVDGERTVGPAADCLALSRLLVVAMAVYVDTQATPHGVVTPTTTSAATTTPQPTTMTTATVWSLFVHAGGRALREPSLAPTLDAGAGIDLGDTFAVRAAAFAEGGPSFPLDDAGTSVGLGLFGVRPALCARTSSRVLTACGGVDAGVLAAQGQGLSTTRVGISPRVDPHASLTLTLPVAEAVGVEMRAMGSVAVFPVSLRAGSPSRTLYAEPVASVAVDVGVVLLSVPVFAPRS